MPYIQVCIHRILRTELDRPIVSGDEVEVHGGSYLAIVEDGIVHLNYIGPKTSSSSILDKKLTLQNGG